MRNNNKVFLMLIYFLFFIMMNQDGFASENTSPNNQTKDRTTYNEFIEHMQSKTTSTSYQNKGWSAFDTVAATEIGKVILFDPPRFYLDMGLPKKEPSFLFYGDRIDSWRGEQIKIEGLEHIKCENSVKFTIFAKANVAGSIKVGVCRSQSKRLHELAEHVKPRLDQVLSQLAKSFPNFDKAPFGAQLAKWGHDYEKNTMSDETEIYYLPLIIVNEGGIGIVSTAIITPAKGTTSLIVECEVMHLCYNLKVQTPICSNLKDTIIDISQRLFRALGEGQHAL